MPNFNQVTKKEVKVREREVQLTQAELAEIKIITKEEASELIEDRLPVGLFMIKEQQVYVGIDNTTGEAWTEEFSNQELCTRWLTGEVGIDELNEQVEEVSDENECNIYKGSTTVMVTLSISYLKKIGVISDEKICKIDEIFSMCLNQLSIDYRDTSYIKDILGFKLETNHEMRIYFDEKETCVVKDKLGEKEEEALRLVLRADVYERKNVNSFIDISQLSIKESK